MRIEVDKLYPDKNKNPDDYRLFQALRYPYPRPDHSFLYADRVASPLNKYVPPKERFFVLAIGSNGAPFQLARKFDQEMVPTESVVVSGMDVVYCPFMCSYGAIPATIVKSPNTKVSIMGNWLTEEQLEKMHLTEDAYDFCKLIPGNGVHVERKNGERIEDVFCYVCNAYQKDDSCVALKEISAENRVFEEMTQHDIQRMIIDNVKESPVERQISLEDFVRENAVLSSVGNTRVEKIGETSNVRAKERREEVTCFLQREEPTQKTDDCWKILRRRDVDLANRVSTFDTPF